MALTPSFLTVLPERAAQWIIPLAALAAALAAFGLARLNLSAPERPLFSLEARLLDMRYDARGPRPAPDAVVVVAIDDATFDQTGRWPLPRDLIGRALTRLEDYGAAAVAMDLLLLETGDPSATRAAEDLVLAQALEKSDIDILAASLGGPQRPLSDTAFDAISRSAFVVVHGPDAWPDEPDYGARVPIPAFAQAAALAHVNVMASPEGALRDAPIARVAPGGFYLPSLSLEAARRALGVAPEQMTLTPGEAFALGERAIPLTPDSALLLNYYGPTGALTTVSLADLLAEEPDPALAAQIRGRAAFLGATALGYGDRFVTPYDPATPGVEALATLAANLIDGTYLRRDGLTRLISLALAAWGAAAACVAAAQRRLWAAAIGSVFVWGALTMVTHMAFSVYGWWLEATLIITATLMGTLLGAVARRITQSRRERNLAQYSSPFLTDDLAAATAPAFDGRPQDAAALFVDLAGYTARAETLGPVGAAQFLKTFHAAVETAVEAHQGVIEQFAGDGAMAIFGLPHPRPDDAARAVACAVALFDEMALLSAALPPEAPPARIRVGAHYGPAVAAVVGGRRHAHVTVTGPTVNIASRLQEVAKQQGAALALSDALWRAAGPEARTRALQRTDFAPKDGVALRGSQGVLRCWLAAAPTLGAGCGANAEASLGLAPDAKAGGAQAGATSGAAAPVSPIAKYH